MLIMLDRPWSAGSAMLAAVLCDLADGYLARQTVNRPALNAQFGKALDSLSDLIHSGVAPAMFVLCIGKFAPWCVGVASAIILTGATRLAYFDCVGLGTSGRYTGIPIFFMPFVVVGSSLAIGSLDIAFYYMAPPVLMMALLEVSTLKVPKLKGTYLVLFGMASLFVGVATALHQ